MHKNWFLGVLKGKESKSAVKIVVKQHFHGENRGCQCQCTFNFWPQVQENIHNLKDQYTYSMTYCCHFFLGNEVCKIKPPCNPKNEHLGELIRLALTRYCQDFRGLQNQTKT